MGNERIVYCPKCGHILRRTGLDVGHSRIELYDAHCDGCGITLEVEDRSNFEQKGKIRIIFN